MYYKSDNAVLDQSIVGNIDTYKNNSVAKYVVFDLMKKPENPFWMKKGIENHVFGYNNENYRRLGNLYSMVYVFLNSLEKNYIAASAALDEIAKLDDNWNNNGAGSFSAKLIEKCRGIVAQLEAEPFICPTACGSIQFEYEKENGEYLEFEIYEDRIEVFLDTPSNGKQEFDLKGSSATDKMKQLVVDFYG